MIKNWRLLLCWLWSLRFSCWLRQQKPDKHKSGVAVTVNAQTTAWSTSQRRKEGSTEGAFRRRDDHNALRYVSAQQLPMIACICPQTTTGAHIVKRYGSVIGKDVIPIPSDTHMRSTACEMDGYTTAAEVLGHSSLNVTRVSAVQRQDIKELYHKTPF